MADISYTIKRNRLKKARLFGMELKEDDSLFLLPEEPERHIYLHAIDSAEERATWGRIVFDAEITENMVIYAYFLATDDKNVYNGDESYTLDEVLLTEDFTDREKKLLLTELGAMRVVDKDDILLYDLQGRFLYVCLDIVGEGEGTLKGLRIDRRGDNFMDAFPSIYRERGGFFHRFMSVFSSIHGDFEREIDDLPKLLDPDTATKDMLLTYGSWLGIDLSGDYLPVETMRTFVREGYKLNRMKGTRACLERVIEIALNERAIILEQNTIRSYLEEGEISEETFSDAGIYDVNILIKKRLSDTDRRQLLHLLQQFVPLRSRLHIIRLKDSGILDTDIYMDMNAVLSGETYGTFDDDMEMDDDIILEE